MPDLATLHNTQCYRERKPLQSAHDRLFASNDYLGLSQHPKVIDAFIEGAKQFGTSASASSHVCGYTHAHQTVENEFAAFTGRDKAVVFGSGFLANLGVIGALSEHSQHLFLDKKAHASIIDAAKLAEKKFYRFAHNDTTHCATLLNQHAHPNDLLISEGVFSTDGQLAPLPELVALAKDNESIFVLDDAHGFGVMGKTGKGVCEHFNLSQQEVPILICPLGKAFGGYGALVAGREALIDLIVQRARSYMYSTALPAAMTRAMTASLHVLQKEPWRVVELQSHIAYFTQRAREKHLPLIASPSAIQSIVIGSNQKTVSMQKTLRDKGFHVACFRPPTVPHNQACIRISLRATHTKANIDTLITLLAETYED